MQSGTSTFIFTLALASVCSPLKALKSGASPRVPILHFVDTSPLSRSDYLTAGEWAQMDAALDLAEQDFFRRYPTCRVDRTRIVKTHSDDILYQTLHHLAETAHPLLAVGFSNTNSCRIALQATQHGPSWLLSIGASGVDLRKAHSNAYSLANFWEKQWMKLKTSLTQTSCRPSHTIGVYDPRHALSALFGEAMEKQVGPADLFRKVFEVSSAQPPPAVVHALLDSECIVMALNYASAEPFLSLFALSQKTQHIFGIGGWNYYGLELRNSVRKLPPYISLHIPTGWHSHANPQSLAFTQRFRTYAHAQAQPIAAFVYDSWLVGLYHACFPNTPLHKIVITRTRDTPRLPLLKSYTGIRSTGNFESPLYMLTLSSLGERYDP